MNRYQVALLGTIFVAAVILRACCLAERPFFCDVPGNVAAVESGSMIIQFPGYAPYHWVIRAISPIFGGAFAGILVFSLFCGVGAMIYSLLFAYERAGYPAALLALVVMGLSPIAIYFSCVGTSYTTELLAMSAIIYHGNRALAKKSDQDYRFAALWYVFGCLMRSLSFPFVGPGLLFLLWKCPTRKNIVFTAIVFALGAVIYSVLTFYYFGSLTAIKASMALPSGALLNPVTPMWIARNEARNIIFVGWSLNIFVGVILFSLWSDWKRLNRHLGLFFLLLTLPYGGMILRYIPHAGYLCLLLPALLCAPWVAEKGAWVDARAVSLAAIFGFISLAQFFLARPMRSEGVVSLALNSYVLTYTDQGIKQGLFDNPTNLASKIHRDKK